MDSKWVEILFLFFLLTPVQGHDHGPGKEMTIHQAEQQNGPLDREIPHVKILQPKKDAVIKIGSSLRVVVNATDNVEISSVRVAFETDDQVSPPKHQEAVQNRKNKKSYKVMLGPVSGPPGYRWIQVLAEDPSRHTGKDRLRVLISQ